MSRRVGGRSEERDHEDEEELHHVCGGVVDLLKGGERRGGEGVRPQKETGDQRLRGAQSGRRRYDGSVEGLRERQTQRCKGRGPPGECARIVVAVAVAGVASDSGVGAV